MALHLLPNFLQSISTRQEHPRNVFDRLTDAVVTIERTHTISHHLTAGGHGTLRGMLQDTHGAPEARASLSLAWGQLVVVQLTPTQFPPAAQEIGARQELHEGS